MKQADVMGWGLMARPPVQYVYGQRPSDGQRTDADISSGELAAFLMAHPEITTKSAKVQRALCFIHSFHYHG